MSTQTSHYGFTKPAGSEQYSLTVTNENWEKLDTELYKLFQYKGDLTSANTLSSLEGVGFWRITSSTPSDAPNSSMTWSFVIQLVYETLKHQYIIKPETRAVWMREYSGTPGSWLAWQNMTPPITRSGIANYSGLKGGGWSDRVTVPITFSSPMPGTSYDVFAVVAGAYADFPYISCTPDGSANTVNGTSIILVNTSGSTTAVSGSIYWFAVMRH